MRDMSKKCKAMVILLMMVISGLIVGNISYNIGLNDSVVIDVDNQIDSSWFKGTWLNNPDYDDATIELFFVNVFDDAIIYTREKGETNWSNPAISDFVVFYSKEQYSYYQNYVLYLELPLESSVYLCTIWDATNDSFEIYYGDNEHMRFYKVGT